MTLMWRARIGVLVHQLRFHGFGWCKGARSPTQGWRSPTDGLEPCMEPIVLQEMRVDLRVTMAGAPGRCSLTAVSTERTVSPYDVWLRYLGRANCSPCGWGVGLVCRRGGGGSSRLTVQVASTMVLGLRC